MQTEATQATCDTDKMPVVSLLVSDDVWWSSDYDITYSNIKST